MFWQFNFLFSTKNCTDLESGITAQKNIWHVLNCNIKLLQYKKIWHSNTQVFLRAHSHDELIRLQFAVDALCGKNFDFFIISSNATNNYTLEVECSDRIRPTSRPEIFRSATWRRSRPSASRLQGSRKTWTATVSPDSKRRPVVDVIKVIYVCKLRLMPPQWRKVKVIKDLRP